jgi:long-chain fatty acid transport protein
MRDLARTALFACLFGAGGIAVARAGTFGLWEGSTDQMANAYAGQGAKAYDAGAAWANPAGMVRLQGTELDTAFNYVDPQFYFSGTDSDFPGQTQHHVSAIYGAFVPSTFAVFSLSPDLKFGFAVKSPFGARINYTSDWVGRYQSVDSSLTDIAVEPSLAYAITRQLSIGGGPVFDYMSVRQTQDILPAIGYQFGDIYGDAHGEDWGVGYNVAALYQFDDDTRFGLSYRSRIEHRIDMKQTLTELPGLANSPYGPFLRELLTAANSPGKGYQQGVEKFNLPDSVDASFYRQLTPEWAVMAEAVWTHWQLFQNITVTTFGTGEAPVGTTFSFHNTVFGSAGASYRPLWMPKLLLQGGAGYDQDPVTNGTRTPQVPTESRVLLGAGLTYDVTRSLSLQFAYSHYFCESASVDSLGTTLGSPLQLPEGRLVGSYDNAIDSFSGGVKLRF